MPSTSKSQQRLFCMALAVRKGDLARNKVSKSVLDIVDGDMTNKQIEDFTVVKEMKSLQTYIQESIKGNIGIGIEAMQEKWLESKFYRRDKDYTIDKETQAITFTKFFRVEGNLPDYINIAEAKCGFEIIQADTLKGCPRKVAGWCCVNNCNLKNLEGMPEYVIGKVCIKNSSIKSLKGLTQNITGVLCVGNNVQHFEEAEVKKLTNAAEIYTVGEIFIDTIEPKLGEYDLDYLKSCVDFEKVKKETGALNISLRRGFGTDIYIRYDFLPENELPNGYSDNGIFLKFVYDLSSKSLVFYNQGHIELTDIDKQGKYKYFALKGFTAPYLDNGGKKFRACRAKDINDAFKRMNTWVKEVYDAALKDQGGRLFRK